MQRKLSTHRIINEILEHPNADALELAHIDGWQVVVGKDQFQAGDSCCFFEIDSWLPADDLRFEFLAKRGTKKDPSGRERFRLRTVKLRGELSQGLALPWSDFFELHEYGNVEGVDFSANLDVIKYERPEPNCGAASGSFPSFLPKTDEERIQNLWNMWKTLYVDELFVPTLKMDGSSCTVAYLDKQMSDYWKGDGLDVFLFDEKIGEIIVCSRNLQLKYNEDSHFWRSAIASGVIEMLRCHRLPLAVQSEVCGPGIQGNKEKLATFELFVFGMFNYRSQEHLSWEDIQTFCSKELITTVLTLDEPVAVFTEFDTINGIIRHADGPSLNSPVREGVVWKCISHPGVSFKVISNVFLLGVEN